MLNDINKLHQLAHKPARTILGLMSGTSLDGLDIALCHIEGNGKHSKMTTQAFVTLAYSAEIKQAILAVFAKPQVELQALCLLNAQIGTLHGSMVKQQLERWQVPVHEVDLIASHGQTIYHAPQSLHQLPLMPNATLQLGDADHIARITGIITLSDFRQKHIAGGGEGAPLVKYGDYLLLGGEHEARCLLNIGGIANLTYIPANADFSDLVCSDIGPGNTLLDAFTRQYFQCDYDKDGLLAAQGTVNQALLQDLLKHAFFTLPMPKTTGPELFNLAYLETCIAALNAPRPSDHDILATLCQFSALAIAQAIKHLPIEAASELAVYASGGGAHNPVLMAHLEHLLGKAIRPTDSLGVSGDAKEAILFAVLANEAVAGHQATFAYPQSAMQNALKPPEQSAPNISMGKISLPT